MTSRAGFAATVLGAMMLLELVIINLAFAADADFVYFLGHRINIVCAARQRYGVPCPTCGLTRGFVLAVHGRVREAWRLSPTGPLAAGGILGMGIALLAFASLERRRTPVQLLGIRRWVQAGALAYGGLATVIWVCSWIAVVTRLK
jgi:uncharacterized protein DUF2752